MNAIMRVMAAVSDSKLEFIRAKPEDGGEVLDWIRAYYTYDHIEFKAEQLGKHLSELLKNEGNGLVYFVEQAGKRIGYFIFTYAFDLEFGGRHAMVTDLFFEASTRRTGAGTKTIQFIEKLCAAQNLTHLLLQVETDNEEAKAFYRKSKFTILTRHILKKELESKSS
jgi:ribosomal protein S18 acetylase RimI-like enzyme